MGNLDLDFENLNPDFPIERTLIVSQNRCEVTLADSVVQLAILCIYMRRMGYDSATVSIKFSSQIGRVVTQHRRK